MSAKEREPLKRSITKQVLMGAFALRRPAPATPTPRAQESPALASRSTSPAPQERKALLAPPERRQATAPQRSGAAGSGDGGLAAIMSTWAAEDLSGRRTAGPQERGPLLAGSTARRREQPHPDPSATPGSSAARPAQKAVVFPAARTLNVTSQSRVTVSLQLPHGKST